MDVKRLVIAAVLFLALGAVGRAQIAPPASQAGSLTGTTCTGTPGSGVGCVSLNVTSYASLSIQLSGFGSATAQFEVSDDGTTFTGLNMTPPNSTTAVTSATGNGTWAGSVAGFKYARVRLSAYSSGTIAVTMQTAFAGGGSGGGGGGGSSDVTIHDPNTVSQKVAVNASGQMSITCANCSGSGASAVDNSAFVAGATSGAPVMGFYHSTIDTVTDGDTAVVAIDSKRNLFEVIRDAAGNARGANVTAGNALVVDGSAVTQPVSAASLPLPTGASTSAKQPAIGAAGTASTDVITIQGIAAMTALKVDGSGVTQPVSGTVTVQQGTAANLKVDLSGTAANATAIKVDGSAVTQPVSGTVTANAGTNLNTSALALESGGNLATVAGLAASQEANTSGLKGIEVFGAVTTNAPSYTTAKSDALSLDTSGLLRISLKDTPQNTTAFKIDGSATTQPVSGTFWQATQPVSGTFWQATQPVSGTVTCANCGTAVSNALMATVGSTRLVDPLGSFIDPRNVNFSGLVVPQNSTTSTQSGPLVQGAVASVAPAYATATTNPLSMTTTGNLRVTDLADGPVTPGTVATNSALIGLQYNATSPSPTSGQQVAAQADSSGRLLVDCAVGCSGGSQTTINVTGAFSKSGAMPTYLVDRLGAYIDPRQGQGTALSAIQTNTATLTTNTAASTAAQIASNSALSALSSQIQALTTAVTQMSLHGAFGQPIGTAANPIASYTAVPAPSFDPCMGTTKTTVGISQTASTQWIAGVQGRRIFICAMQIGPNADAENVSLVEGTGAVCATGTVALDGSTSAGNGTQNAANGGFAIGNGAAGVIVAQNVMDNICLLQSGSGRVAGFITYAIQ